MKMTRFKESVTKISFLLVCLFLLSLVILVMWFKAGKLYGGGDIGLPTYNPTLLSQIAKYTWWEAQGTGFSYPAISASYPFYLLLSIPQKLGLNPLGIQILFFGAIIFFSLSGVFLFFYLTTKNRSISFLAALFYLINPYTMMNIFHRFNHTSMVIFAFLPWTLIFLYLGVSRKKIILAPLLALSSLIAAYAFGTPAFLATWWFLVISFYIYLVVVEKKVNLRYKLLFFITLVFFWLGLNLWWLMPFSQTANAVLLATTTTSGNIESLKGVSQYFELPFAFRGINSFFLTQQVDWGDIYANPFFNLLSWIGLCAILLSLFSKKVYKYQNYFLLLFLIAIFISKGSGIPFGNLLVGAFAAFPILGVFRNPFEKFGILIPLAGAILFAYGIDHLYLALSSRFNKKSAKTFLICGLGGFFIVYHWPIWSGNIFGSVETPAFIEVPKEYNQVGTQFNVQDKSLRILHLPLVLGDSIVYSWKYGYSGLETSQLFFPGSSISHLLGSTILDIRYMGIAQSIKSRDKELFAYLLHNYKINYLVLHNDIDSSQYNYDYLSGIKVFLSSLPDIKFVNSFGKLDIYIISSNQDTNQIYFSTNPTIVSGDLHYFDEWFFPQNYHPNLFVRDSGSTRSITENQDLVFPSAVIDYPYAIVSPENALYELSSVKYSPQDPIYNLIRLKESLGLLAENDEQRFLSKLNLTGKRLVEVRQLLAQSNQKQAESYFDDYRSQLQALLPIIKERIINANFGNDIDGLQLYQGILLRQETVMKTNILPLAKGSLYFKVSLASTVLDQQIAETGLAPLYPSQASFPNPTLRFKLLKAGDYYLLLKKENWQTLFSSESKIKLLVDGQERVFEFNNDTRNFKIGPIKFSTGEHEIVPSLGDLERVKKDQTLITASNKDLVTSLRDSDGYEILARSEVTSIDYDIGKVYSDSLYQISFQFWTKEGLTPELSVIEDSNKTKKGKLLPTLIKGVPGLSYDYYWRTMAINFKPNRLTEDMMIRISLKPWNNCSTVYQSDQEKCKNQGLYNGYNRDSLIQIRNVSVKQIPVSGLALVKDNIKINDQNNYISKLEQVDPTKYNLHLASNQTGVLVLNQSYNDGWELKDQSGNQLKAKHVLVNGYANGWILPTSFDQEMIVEFSAQNKIYQGLLLGGLILFVGSLLTIGIWRKYEKI